MRGITTLLQSLEYTIEHGSSTSRKAVHETLSIQMYVATTHDWPNHSPGRTIEGIQYNPREHSMTEYPSVPLLEQSPSLVLVISSIFCHCRLRPQKVLLPPRSLRGTWSLPSRLTSPGRSSDSGVRRLLSRSARGEGANQREKQVAFPLSAVNSLITKGYIPCLEVAMCP